MNAQLVGRPLASQQLLGESSVVGYWPGARRSWAYFRLDGKRGDRNCAAVGGGDRQFEADLCDRLLAGLQSSLVGLHDGVATARVLTILTDSSGAGLGLSYPSEAVELREIDSALCSGQRAGASTPSAAPPASAI